MTANHPVDIVVEFSTPFYPLDAFMGKHLHLGWQPEPLISEALRSAQQADVAVVFVNQAVGEGMDLDSFALPGDQDRLIEAICAANPNTVVVLNTPGAVLMPWLDQAAAVLQIWYPGEAIGTALAAVLFGESEPAGRLPLTFPASEDQALLRYAGGGSVDFLKPSTSAIAIISGTRSRPYSHLGMGCRIHGSNIPIYRSCRSTIR